MKGLAKIAGPRVRVNSVSPGLLLTVSFEPSDLRYVCLTVGRTGAVSFRRQRLRRRQIRACSKELRQ